MEKIFPAHVKCVQEAADPCPPKFSNRRHLLEMEPPAVSSLTSPCAQIYLPPVRHLRTGCQPYPGAADFGWRRSGGNGELGHHILPWWAAGQAGGQFEERCLEAVQADILKSPINCSACWGKQAPAAEMATVLTGMINILGG